MTPESDDVSRTPIRKLTTAEALRARHERRAHLRTTRRERLFVQLGPSPDDPANRLTLKCHSADLSRGGLRVRLSEAVPVGAELELWVRVASTRRNFYLTGDVRWCVADGERHEVGIRVTDGPGTDVRAWRKLCFT